MATTVRRGAARRGARLAFFKILIVHLTDWVIPSKPNVMKEEVVAKHVPKGPDFLAKTRVQSFHHQG